MLQRYFTFQWHITDRCDQCCSHCYIYSGHFNKIIEEMTLEQMKYTIECCLAFCKKFSRKLYFCITGGDPLLHKNFWQLLALLKENNIPFSIMGNPYHLDDEVCKELKNAGCRQYQMSIDGVQKTHDKFRKVGSFYETLQKIKCINSSGIQSLIMTTVTKENIDEIPEIIDEVVQYKVGLYGFARFCPSYKVQDIGIKPLEYRRLLEICDKKFKEYPKNGCETVFSKKDHLWTLYDYEMGKFSIPSYAQQGKIYGGCHCGNSHLTILPSGDIWACRRVPDSKVGNIWEDTLEDIWLNKMEEYRKFENFSKCSECELLAWCRGCPAVAKGTSGDFYGEDPQCWKDNSCNCFFSS